MTFGPSHYVPVLKVKRGEKSALQLVAFELREHITPLLEIVEWEESQKKPTLSGHLDTAFKGLAKSLLMYPRCFLDARELAPVGPSAAEQVFTRAAGAGIPFIPVTGINRADASAAMSNQDRGLAIRLTRDEFEAGDLSSSLFAFMKRHGIGVEDTDLIMDLGPVEEMVTDGVTRFATQFLGDVPDPNRWRTLTLTASAFPQSMAVVERHSHTLVARAEWLTWKRLRGSGQLVRVPTFSDCAIQHPVGVEGFDPRKMRASASVRYALADNWLLIKGESTGRRGVTRFATQFLGDVPDPNRWRTLTLTASAFPQSMAVVERHSHTLVARAEWLTWKRLRGSGQLVRVPTFSDCAIQHPVGVEGFDPRKMRASASVRYALADNWLLIKGESTGRRLASLQFPLLAKRLAYGHLRHHFHGETHCEGCASIKRAADGQPRLGSPEVWRRIGTVHHITEVTRKLRSLPGS